MEPRRCDYNGRYYCPLCHKNNTFPIPARILHNWDFEERPVAEESRQFLTLMARKPNINLDKINPKLFSFVEDLNVVKVRVCPLANLTWLLSGSYLSNRGIGRTLSWWKISSWLVEPPYPGNYCGSWRSDNILLKLRTCTLYKIWSMSMLEPCSNLSKRSTVLLNSTSGASVRYNHVRQTKFRTRSQ